MSVGKTIKMLRQLKGVDQSTIASDAGISTSYLSQIENDLKNPTLDIVQKIADTLEVDMVVLFVLSKKLDDVPEPKRELFKKLREMAQSELFTLFD